MGVKKALEEIVTKATKNVGDLDASAGSGKGAVGGAAGRAKKKAGKQKKVKRLSIFDRNNTEGIFSKSGAFKEGAADAVPEAVRSLLQSPDGGPTLNDLTGKELRSLHKELIASGNENLANNLVKRTEPKNWTTTHLKAAENAQPLPDDGSDVLAKGNPDPNDLNGTTRKPRKRPVSDVTVTNPDGEEVKAVDSNTFRKQDRPLPEDDLYQQYVSNGIKDVDLKQQLDALFKSPGLQSAYRADRGLDDTASIFATGRGGSLSDDYKAWILEKSNDGGVEFFDKALASGRNNVPKRNAVPRTGIDKVTTANEKGVRSASQIAGADVGAPQGTEDFRKRVTTEGNVDPAELPGANVTVNGRKQATLPTDAKRQMGVEDLVESLRAEATPEVLRIIADGSDVESSEMAYKVVEAFLNRRIPTGDRVGETTHRAAVQAGADALAASLNRPPYKELHPSILEANDAATRIDIESGKQPVKGQPVEISGAGNAVDATADGSTLTPSADTRNILGSNGEPRNTEGSKGPSKKQLKQLDEQNFPGDEDAAPVWQDGSLKKDAETATNALTDDPELLEPVPEDIASTSKKAPKGKPKSSKKPAAEEPVGDELPEVSEAMKGETVSSFDDDRKAFTTANLRKYVVEKLVENNMSEADAKKFVKQMDRKQLLNEYEASSGNNGVGRVEQYPGRTPQDASAGTSPRPTGMQEFGPSAGPSGKDNVNTKLTPFEVRSSDTGKYPDKPIPTRRDYKKGQGFDNDVENAKVDKTVDDVEKWAVRGGTTVGLGLLAAWMVSQGMSGDDDEGKSTMQPGGSVDNPAMPQGGAAGGGAAGGGGTGGGMGGGGGMSPLERIRAAQGDRYVAGLAGTQTVRGFR
tara:strand:- start:202 stop:2793 length:2592 start_codon:yes stop_codon:yes gene_type:complete